jgi:ligand-binding sensor domain-containing protein
MERLRRTHAHRPALHRLRRRGAVICSHLAAALLCGCESAAPTPREEAEPARVRAALGAVVPSLDESCWVVFEDRDGNLWFGSDGNGVSRFDGQRITRFTTAHGLSNDHVRGIQQHEPSGAILISTNGGVSRFDGQELVTLPVVEMGAPMEGWTLAPDDVWIQGKSGPKGPLRYDGRTLYALQLPQSPQEKPPRATDPPSPWNPYEVWTVYRDRRGHLWFGTALLGVCRFDGSSCDWMYEEHLSQLPGNALWGIRAILEDRQGDFWICNTSFRFDMQPHRAEDGISGSIAYARKPGAELRIADGADATLYFMSIVDDANGVLWMAPYGGGVWSFDGNALRNYPLRADGNDITMFSIYRDRRGGLWVGTHEHGPYRFNGTSFEPFRP